MALHTEGKRARRTKRIAVAAVALVALVAAGVALAVTAANTEEPDYSGLAVEGETTLPQPPRVSSADEADGAQDAGPAPESTATEGAEPARPLASPSTTGALHVEGAHLVDAAGNPVQLRGVSTHGIAWYPQYVNQEFFNELKQEWGANVVRLALYSAEEGGYATDASRADLNERVLAGVEYATAADMYVVVDWHNLTDGNPLTNAWAAAEFFRVMARDLADHDNVIYEICNEPNGSTTWADVKAYAAEIIPVIRAADPDAVIVVGTPTWSQDIQDAAADPIAESNIMYALHFYAATHQADLRDRLRAAVEGGLPVFVTEFGLGEASGDGKIDYESADAWLELMDELQVSYICWNLSNKKETAALFKPKCDKVSGFTLDDLTDTGLWLVDALRGPGFDAKDVMLARADKKSNKAGAAMMAFSSDTIQWQLSVADTWKEGDRTFFKYEMTGSNYSAGMEAWSVTIPFNEDIEVQDSWNCTVSVDGNELTVSNDDHNGSVGAGDTVRDVGFIVSGTAKLAVVDL